MIKDTVKTQSPAGLPSNAGELSALYHYIMQLDRHREYEKCREMLSLLTDFAADLPRDTLLDRQELATTYRLSAENHIRTGEVSKAAELYQKGIRLFPQSAELMLGYAECLIRLYLFDESEQVLQRLNPEGASAHDTGLHTYRKNTVLGELYQRREHPEQAWVHYTTALKTRPDWIPAHIGLAETAVIKGDMPVAKAYIEKVIESLGPEPYLLLMLANIALISSEPMEALELASRINGRLLGDDRFEYFLFQLDFFSRDQESLRQVPYRISGEHIETEAARIWLMNFKGQPYETDSSRIPEEVWWEEYQALERAWYEINLKQRK